MKLRLSGALGLCVMLAACQTDGGGLGGGSGGGSPAASGPEQACITKLAEMAKAPAASIKTTSTTETMGGYLVMLEVAGGTPPWRCTVDTEGVATVEPVAVQ